MEEKVLIKGNIAQSVKSVFKWIIITFITLSILCLFVGVLGSIIGKEQCERAHLEEAWNDYRGEYDCPYCFFSCNKAEEYLNHIKEDTHGWWYSPYWGYGINNEVFYIVHWSLAGAAGIVYLTWFLLSKYSLTVTDKNVYGKNCFGKKVALPLHMISAYATRKFLATVIITTMSGRIKFLCQGNYNEIAGVLQQLLNERQKNTEIQEGLVSKQNDSNYLDGLIKLKTLLDNGIITQEEFEAKKKEILGL